MYASPVTRDVVAPVTIASPQHLRRPRLHELFAAAAEARFSGIGSPAGRGVSLALRHWAEANDEVIVVDAEAIAAPTRREFWLRVCQHAAARGLPVNADALHAEARLLPIAVTRAFERIERRTVLVIDHLDEVPEPDSFGGDLLRLLLATERIHVLVAARDLRPARLSTAQLQVSTGIIDAAAFEFTTEETFELLRQNGRAQTVAQAESLRRQCFGNAAILGALAALGELSPATVAGLTGRVREVVLRPWVTHPQFERLMELAIPEHLDAETIDALGIPGYGSLFDALESSGQGGWDFHTRPASFRIDPLLRFCLENELERRSPRRCRELRDAAVRRELDRGNHLEAVHLAVRLGDWRSVRRILRTALDEVIDPLVADEGFASAVLHTRQYTKDPLLAVVLGMHEAEAGHFDRASQAFATALRGAQRVVEHDGIAPADEVTVLRVVRFIAFSRLCQHGQAAREAGLLERMLSDVDGTETAIRPMRLTAHLEVAEFALRDCRHPRARRHLAAAGYGGWADHPLHLALSALHAAMDGDVRHAESALARIDLGAVGRRAARFAGIATALVALEAGRLDEVAAQVAEFADRMPDPELWPIVVVLQSYLCDDDGVVARLDSRWSRYEAVVPVAPRMRRLLFLHRYRQLVRTGRWREAFRLVKESRSAQGFADDFARAQCSLLAGEYDQAVVVAERHAWRDAVPPRERTALLMIAASAHRRLGAEAAARERAGEAVTLALATGLRTPLGLVPREDLEALAGALAGEVTTRVPDPPRVVRLSPREHAVLSQLEHTGSLAEIAEALSVSVNTVRSQLTAVYRKLGVSSRADALRLAASGEVILR